MEIKLTHLIVEGILPMYAAPDTHQVISDEALYGMQCQVMEEKSGFAHIRMEYGYQGWVQKEGIREGLWSEKIEKLRVIKRMIDVLAKPEVDSEILVSVPLGSVLGKAEESLQEDLRKGWICVLTADGRVGYTKTSYFVPYIPLQWSRPDVDEEEMRERLVKAVKLYEGTHYRWGGKSPMGIDCSGLCSMAYMLSGVIIYRDAAMKPEYCLHSIERKDMKAGDLILFPGHVAMYLGGERQMYIHSTAYAGSDGVDYNSLLKGDPLYRADLDESIEEIGSIF